MALDDSEGLVSGLATIGLANIEIVCFVLTPTFMARIHPAVHQVCGII